MEMTLRWYGSKFDTVTLKQIRQIPGVTGVITTLYDTGPGAGIHPPPGLRRGGGAALPTQRHCPGHGPAADRQDCVSDL